MTFTNALSILEDIASYAQASKHPSSARKPIKLGTIDPGYNPDDWPAGTPPRVTFDGESTLSAKLYPVMGGYWPHPGDRVVLLPVGTTYLIIGALAEASAHIGGNLHVDGDITTSTSTDWTTPTFQNSWGNFGSGFQVAQYRRDEAGRVWIRGTISGGTAGTVAFRLPAGFRPPAMFVVDAISSGGNPPDLCRLEVQADGDVIPRNTVTSFVALDVVFYTK